MNPETDPQPLLPPQPPHLPSSTACDRHPDEIFTGFCPLCLYERLSGLDPSSTSASSSSSARKPPTASSTTAAAIKAIFKPTSSSARPTSFYPELRRAKSFSASKNEGLSGVFEPQRKSCDVRVRSTLGSLFVQIEGEVGIRRLAPSSTVQEPVFESKEEEARGHGDDLESDASEELNNVVATVIEDRVQEIVEEEEEEELEEAEKSEEELKTMKDHIDLASQSKKPSSGRDKKDISSSFRSAASVFSKKWQKWRHKQKHKKHRNGEDDKSSTTLPVDKPIGRHFRETQSEIADYGLGRRSCDIDPRFSLDVGRISFDDARNSFDEPRASWDGYFVSKTFPKMPTMVSVDEDADPTAHASCSDTRIPLEKPEICNLEGESVPGGSVQTRDYYLDSSSRRRKSLDRSSSVKKISLEIDEIKSGSNAKVTPALTSDFLLSGSKLDNNSSKDSNPNSLEKKSRRWNWNMWGLMNRRGGSKDEDEDGYSGTNGVEVRSFSESWDELRGGGERNGNSNPKMLRSSSSSSWRNYSSGGNGRRKRDGFVLERNGSARYSPPNHLDNNGLLRFYLRSSWRAGFGKNRQNQAHSLATN